ncbi:HlyD family efflux transporter periplasmic adaptor subunit [Metapseudomonas lalkuanensis]|uniref:HlyD family efflux transporter periplasmic adaptor subunit n=1 Tax=Metapseudomonas lalkuanensis TaxID=2604832 RepID=A0A5J6QGR0_9GAMM|nr:alginate biosynthesis protein Alg44 [Pseudomonas lalkuanensis]QEY61543.1 HlyD family efflux transporter periplasmic adaptor subunit [Pseudomonas lalkuanensis]UCO99305.1 alginate biosynthesis protein Alg44 [Pseudomonas lalkuanensis]
MNTAVNLNVVHESEAQRQHARVKIPGKVRYIARGERFEASLLDVSAGGFAFTGGRSGSTIGDHHKGRLMFQIDGLSLGLDIEFQVRAVDARNERVGCVFHNLQPRDIATLRYLISAHLSGELVSAGDLLNTLQRENFTKPRKGGAGGGMGPLARLKAVGLSAGIFVVGVGAFGYILNSLYGLYFVTHADSAMVAVPSMQVTMPREGTVQSLVSADASVEKGAPIASFSATMLEMLKGHLTDDQLTPKNVEELFGKQMKGTLTSPCNCKIARQLVADGQFASKGDVIFELVPQDTQATVQARFPFRNIAQARPGARVTFQVAGEDQVRHGKILSSNLHDGSMSADIRATIQPDEPLPSTLAGQPVEVSVDRGPSLDWLIDRALATGF